MQNKRDKTTLGLAFLVAAISVMGKTIPWVSAPMLALAIFFMAWGRDKRRVEAFIGRLPGGYYLLNRLNQLDLILSPRDEQADALQAQINAKVERKTANLAKLQEFYAAGTNIARRLQQFRGEDVTVVLEVAGRWRMETARWIRSNIGPAPEARYLDTTGMRKAFYVANENQNKWILLMHRWCENLRNMIENYDAWVGS